MLTANPMINHRISIKIQSMSVTKFYLDFYFYFVSLLERERGVPLKGYAKAEMYQREIFRLPTFFIS